MGKKSVGPSSALMDLAKSSHFASDREARGVRESVPISIWQSTGPHVPLCSSWLALFWNT
jgi:hypothetical protein